MDRDRTVLIDHPWLQFFYLMNAQYLYKLKWYPGFDDEWTLEVVAVVS